VTPRSGYPVAYRRTPIGAGNEPYPADGEWAEPDLDEAAEHIRSILEDPADARARAAAGREEVARRYSLEGSGAEMGARLARVTLGGTGRNEDGSAVDELIRVLETELQPRPGRSAEAVRGGMRRALYRALRPYTTHRREVDAELIRTLRALEERIDGLERSLAVLKEMRRDD
jgi:hypothetical protein